ncbi:helix-turn-helix domain-containing protein [Nonomuraea fuscirosea]|uniref:helix-turn-helix domain-containing protein n=1 Tax=Nonomuraea fuscirosea TaxID=1291556 RepID=UPI0033F59239
MPWRPGCAPTPGSRSCAATDRAPTARRFDAPCRARCPERQPDRVREELLKHATVSSIARLLNVSRSTIYKYVPELVTGHPAAERPTV